MARAIRTTKALGTSWISRHDSPPIKNVVDVAYGALPYSSSALVGSSSTRVSGGEMPICWPSTTPIAAAAAAIIWLAASAIADSSNSESC